MHNNTLERVTNILAEQMGVNADDINVLEPVHELGTDSLDNIEIVLALEEEFEIDISDWVAEKFEHGSVMDIVKAIDSDLSELPGPKVSVVAQAVAFKSQGKTFDQVVASINPDDFKQEIIGVLGDITVAVDKTAVFVKVDGDIHLNLDRSNGNIEDLCRLLMKSSTK